MAYVWLLWLILCHFFQLDQAYAEESLRDELERTEDLLYDDPYQAVKVYRSIKDRLSPEKNPDLWLKAIIKQNAASGHIGETSQSPAIIQQASAIADTLGDPVYQALIIIQKVALLDLTRDSDRISHLLEQGERFAEASGDWATHSLMQIYRSEDAHRQGRPDLAAMFLNQSFMTLKKAPRNTRYYAMMNNFGAIFYKSTPTKLSLAIEILQEVATYTQKRNLRFLGGLSFYHLGNAYLTANRLDEAVKTFQTSKAFAEKINDQLGVAYAISGIAAVEQKKGRHKEVIAPLQNALRTVLEYNDQGALIDISVQLAESLSKAGQPEAAYPIILKAKQQIDNTRSTQPLLDILRVETEVLEKLGRQQHALLNYKRIAELQSKTFSEKSRDLAIQYATEYELGRREEQNVLLEQRNRIQSLEIESRNRTSAIMSLSLMSALVALGLILFDFVRVRKRNRDIQSLHQYIEKNVLQRFLPPVLVQEILEGKSRLDEHARMETVTVMFADLCHFTSATDRLGPEVISKILNDFFINMSEVIFTENGTIDKFIGDAIMIIFGAPVKMSPDEQATRAVECAKKMQDMLASLNSKWEGEHGQQFELRIGIHQGQGVVGSFGGHKRSDYTVVGNSVNVAARVEGLADPNTVLVTEAITQYLPVGTFQLRGTFKLRGLNQEMPLYRMNFQRLPTAESDSAASA